MCLNMCLYHFPVTTDTSGLSGHAFIFKHTPVSQCSVNINLRSPPPFYIILNLLLDPHPLGGVCFPPVTPGLFLWFRKWLTCHRKQMGVWAWRIASSPHTHLQPPALGGGVFSYMTVILPGALMPYVEYRTYPAEII